MIRKNRFFYLPLCFTTILLIVTFYSVYPTRSASLNKMQVIGVRDAPFSQEALINDLKRACQILNFDFKQLKIPNVIWLDNVVKIRIQHNIISSRPALGNECAIYARLSNTIYLSKEGHQTRTFYHEIAHCVSIQLGPKLSRKEEELQARAVAEAMLWGDKH